MRHSTLTLVALLAAGAAHAIPEGPEPSTPEWFAREAANHERSTQAIAETVGNPEFDLVWVNTQGVNRQQWIDRALADPSWVGYPSGNTPNTPAGAMWTSVASSDPTRYPTAPGPNGAEFYEKEGERLDVVFYDYGCARISAKVWAPRSLQPGQLAPGVVIQNGSIQASQTMYWWFAQTLVRAGYVVMTFDPRGQGRSDMQTPDGEQGGNANSEVFFSGMVNAIDFFRSTPAVRYGTNVACEGTYPTEVAPFNPFFDRIDPSRFGIAGHSLGASGISSVQGYPGSRFQIPDAGGGNPVDVIVAWDQLGFDPEFPPRVPAMGQSSEYFAGQPMADAPEPDEHKDAYAAYVAAGQPAYQFTIQGSTHFEWSQVPGFPATSWCPDISSGSCQGGWGVEIARHYSLAWLDRWLKKPGEAGYDDADARLLDDKPWCDHYSFYFRSARKFTDRGGKAHASEDIRADSLAGKVDAPAGKSAPASSRAGGLGTGLLLALALAVLGRRRVS